ncbi:MAG: DUF3667 domain-containing protein [Calditrichaeota bacterium]|nr:MAG: DUF3667 domain-containing protein [Calditrichota bacterium]MBL1204807.1 DUF3667 domain-containing protein [Calditrichota bacterium]NOG44636.1 DUF3667 domain-containing protein [Calditrichota bacterium]
MPKKFLKNDICHNCKTHIGDNNYCPNCGQINSHKQIHLAQILKDLLGDYFTFDSKFFRSIWPLVGKPGHLTTEYVSGRRNTYILPLRLYIFTTFLFFLILSLSSKVDPFQIEEQQKHNVTADSLRQFLGSYKQDIPEDIREKLVLDLGINYKLEKKEKRDFTSSFVDSIKEYLEYANPQINDTLSSYYSTKIYSVFKFFKRNGRVSKPADKKLMEKLLDEVNYSQESKDLFFSRIDTGYIYRKTVWKSQNVNITFSGEDTASVGFLRELEKKAEYMFSQGSKGIAIFWSELIRQIPKIMFLVLPLFALLLKLFYIRQKIFYFNHLIFALHVHSLLFMYLIIAILIPNGWVIAGSILAIWVHTFLAFKNVYRQGKILTFFKLNSILLIYSFVNIFAFILLSMLAVWSV